MQHRLEAKFSNQYTFFKRGNKNQFIFHKIIGKGGFGLVWKVSCKRNKQTYALKVIDKAKVITKKCVSSVMNERQILANIYPIQNGFVINMKEAFQDRQNLYLLMDYLDSGDLRTYINTQKSFSESQIKFIVRCIMEGLNFLHEHNIIHRDLKPQNIVLDKDGYARITDLGVARYWRLQNSGETSGTPGYMAPQVLLRQNHSFCVDYYAVGVITYELIMGKRPYKGRQRKDIRDQMLAQEAKIPIAFKDASKDAIDFVNGLLKRQARRRLGYNSINEIMDHPWLKMSNEDIFAFRIKKKKSPIIPLPSSQQPIVSQVTQSNEVLQQNIMIIKRPQVQKMFENYEFNPMQTTIGSQSRVNLNKIEQKAKSPLYTPTSNNNSTSVD